MSISLKEMITSTIIGILSGIFSYFLGGLGGAILVATTISILSLGIIKVVGKMFDRWSQKLSDRIFLKEIKCSVLGNTLSFIFTLENQNYLNLKYSKGKLFVYEDTTSYFEPSEPYQLCKAEMDRFSLIKNQGKELVTFKKNSLTRYVLNGRVTLPSSLNYPIEKCYLELFLEYEVWGILVKKEITQTYFLDKTSKEEMQSLIFRNLAK